MLKKGFKRFRNETIHNMNLLTEPPQMPFGKAFVIGLGKTGTSSVKDFLRAHGSRHLTIFHKVVEKWQVGNYEYIFRCLAHYNSFDDRPWNRLDVIERVVRVDDDYRFILTTRDPDKWFDSRVRYSKKLGRPPLAESMRTEAIEAVFHPHYEKCRKLAAENGKGLLEIDETTQMDVGKKIEQFLQLPEGDFPFPHSNRSDG